MKYKFKKICLSGCKQDSGNKDDILCLLQKFTTITIFVNVVECICA